MRVRVVYSPQPDERPEASAAQAYAERIKEFCGEGLTTIERLELESLGFLSSPATTPKATTTGEDLPELCILILSCSADGSVDRVVRKLTRSLKSSGPASHKDGPATANGRPTRFGVALLGHARCETSAAQMEDTVFGTGRKFHAALRSRSAFSGDRLEIQAELEGPEAPGGFDEWFNRQVEEIIGSEGC